MLVELKMPKFQKQSALKLAGRIIPPQAKDIVDIRGIPLAKRMGINDSLFERNV